jgi:iron-sulfur cluster assembly protein
VTTPASQPSATPTGATGAEASPETVAATPAEPKLFISEAAAKEIARQRDKRGKPGSAIRVGIRGGGCTGFSYLFEWEDGEPRGTDRIFEAYGVRVVTDPKSLVYLAGTELDFVSGMMGHGFKFNNPNVKGSCGCGESVQF